VSDDDEIADLSDSIDPFDIPCCPFCDNAILMYEPGYVFIAHGVKALAHIQCIAEARR